jgi:hypothetical protein
MLSPSPLSLDIIKGNVDKKRIIFPQKAEKKDTIMYLYKRKGEFW